MLHTFLAHLLTGFLVLLTVYVWCSRSYPEPQIHDFVSFPSDYFMITRTAAAEQTSTDMEAVLRGYLRNLKRKHESAKRMTPQNGSNDE